jgi:hypothetical protein
VLHRPRPEAPETLAGALGAELESELRRIYERARTVDEIDAELRKLQERIGAQREQFEATQARVASLIQAHLDEEVRRLFKRLQGELPPALAALDRDMDHLVCGYLETMRVPFERIEVSGRTRLVVPPAATLPTNLSHGVHVAIGSSSEGLPSLHLTHPLVVAALEAAQSGLQEGYRVSCRLIEDAPPELTRHRGAKGRLVLIKVRYEGFEPVEELLPVALLEGDPSPLPIVVAQKLIWSELTDLDQETASRLTDDDLEDAIERVLFDLESRSIAAEQQRFDRAIAQVERFVDDRILLLKRRREDLLDRFRQAEEKRDRALGPDARAEAEARLHQLQLDIDETENRIAKLERRDDVEFVRLRDRINGRHFAPKKVERILQAELVIE